MSVCTLIVPHSCYKTCRSKSTQSQVLLFSFRLPARNAQGLSFSTTPNPLWDHLPPVKEFCRQGKGSQEAPSNIDDMHRMNAAVYLRSKCDHWYPAWQPHALARKPSKRLHAAQQRRSDS